jgi:transposase
MKFYGDELRLKVVESRRKGFKYSEIAEIFSISIISAMRYVRLYKETGSVSKKVRIYRESCQEWYVEFCRTLEIYKQAGRTIIYIDESGFHLNMAREWAWGCRGELIHGTVSGKRTGKKHTLVAGLLLNKIIAPITFIGITDSEVFNSWLNQALLPEIQEKNCILVMDNAAFHKGQETIRIIENQGHTILFLPPYSPHLNPIEKIFGNMKKIYRNAEGSIQNEIERMEYSILKFT